MFDARLALERCHQVAVEADEEAEARSIMDMLIGKMEITLVEPLAFDRFDEGAWVAEMHVDTPRFEQDEPGGRLSILATLYANLGPVTWRGGTNMPSVPDSASVVNVEWSPGYWALLGRKETLVHPAVCAMQLIARRRNLETARLSDVITVDVWFLCILRQGSYRFRRHVKTGELAFYYCCVPAKQRAARRG